IFLFVLLSTFSTVVFSQEITYSEPESQDSRTLDFQIIGKIDGNFLVYKKRNTIYCMAFKLNAEGKLLTDPIQLDTTHINFLADNKIYSTAFSEDKSQIMIYKIQRQNGNYNF